MNDLLYSGDWWNLINVLASLIVFINGLAFYFMLFGQESVIDRRPIWEIYMIKIGLITITFGTLINVLTWSYPPINEILITIGLAVILTWGVIFHYKLFKQNLDHGKN